MGSTIVDKSGHLNPLTEPTQEDLFWLSADPDHLWGMDKLILARKLGYVCGPVGQDVPTPGYYIVRPCVNMLGLGLEAKKYWIEDETHTLTIGHFWCEWFEGRHLSVDYTNGICTLAVEGFKSHNTLTKWDRWVKVDEHIALPTILEPFKHTYPNINCEFIDGKLIEVHFRANPDFDNGITEFIPVWQGQDQKPPTGYRYIQYPDMHGRIGAFIK